MSRFSKLVDEIVKHGSVDAVLASRTDEVSPPGFKGTVKAMKDEPGIDNEYALGWWMKNKGYKSHKKADGTAKNESLREDDHLTQNVVDGVVRHIFSYYPEIIQQHGQDKVQQVAYENTYWLTDDWPEGEGFGGSDSYGPVKSTLAHFGVDHDAELQKRREAEAQRREAPQKKIGESPFTRSQAAALDRYLTTDPGDAAAEAEEAVTDDILMNPQGNEAILGMVAEKLGHDANDWKMVRQADEVLFDETLGDIVHETDPQELMNYSRTIAQHFEEPDYEPDFDESTGSGVDVDEIDVPAGVGGHAYDDDLTLDDLDIDNDPADYHLDTDVYGGDMGDVEETVGHGEPPDEIDLGDLHDKIMADPGANQELMQAAASLAGYGQHDYEHSMHTREFHHALDELLSTKDWEWLARRSADVAAARRTDMFDATGDTPPHIIHKAAELAHDLMDRVDAEDPDDHMAFVNSAMDNYGMPDVLRDEIWKIIDRRFAARSGYREDEGDTNQGVEVPCPTCSGRGGQRDREGSWEYCDDCNGSGKVPFDSPNLFGPLDEDGADEDNMGGKMYTLRSWGQKLNGKTGVTGEITGRYTPQELETYKRNWEANKKKREGDRNALRMDSLEVVPMEESEIRIFHPVHGKATVLEITESEIVVEWDNLLKRMDTSSRIAFKDAKYLKRIEEDYTDNPEDADIEGDDDNLIDAKDVKHKAKKGMKKGKNRTDEGLVAMAMAPIGGTHIGNSQRSSLDDSMDLSWGDVMFDMVIEDEYEDEDDNDSEASGENSPDWDRGDTSHDNSDRSELRKGSEGGADYTNVPRPADTVLTNQENQPEYKANPLSTVDGADAANDGQEPDGDYGEDLVPGDAPDIPDYRAMDTDRGNTVDAGEGSGTTQETGAEYNDYKDSGGESDDSPEDHESSEEESTMTKNEGLYLTAEDLGLVMINEGQAGAGHVSGYAEDYGMTEHDMGGGEIAFTKELLDKLLASVATQAPDESKIQFICQGLEAAQQEKGDSALDVADMELIKGKMRDAANGGGGEMDAAGGEEDYAAGDEDMDPVGDEGGEDYAAGSDDMGDDYDNGEEEEPVENCGDYYDADEDRAKADGKKAGPEGGEEHEGRPMLMDRKGGYDKDSGHKVKGQARPVDKGMKRRKPKKSAQYEQEGSGTPVGTGSTAGPGGGNTTDLSKPKDWKGKALGSEEGGGPGGGSKDEYGQKPSKDGGSNLLPANDKGSSLGAADTNMSTDTPLNPQNKKALAAESRKAKKESKDRLDENIFLGIAGIPSTLRYGADASQYAIDPNDPNADLKQMRRAAGIENWWEIK